jgi:short-subunit dehydrogenase
MHLREATTVVTGASAGIGPAIARACHDAGSRLVLTGRNEVALRNLAAELDARVVVADLTRSADVARLAAESCDADVLVSNAALPGGGDVASFSPDEIDRLLDTNVRAPIMLSRSLAEHLVERRHGQLVFVSSLAAAFPTPELTLYNASKAALDSYALSLRGELARHGVGVSLVRLGPIRDAGMWAETGLAPRGLRTRSPSDVGVAVVRAIEQNRAELNVAPASLRIGARLARLWPAAFARVAPMLGASRVTGPMAEALRDKR